MTTPNRQSIQGNLLIIVMLALVGSLAVAAAAWQAYSRAADSIRQSNYDRLTMVREAKRRQVTFYLDRTRAEVERLARAQWLAEATFRHLCRDSHRRRAE